MRRGTGGSFGYPSSLYKVTHHSPARLRAFISQSHLISTSSLPHLYLISTLLYLVCQVVDRSDSQVYALRRFDNVRTSPTVLKNALGKWYDVRHPSIVSLYSVSAERGALFFTHAYHPAAQTLKQRFIDQRGPLLNEALLWRVLTQLLSGLRLVHGKNMALRVISPVHVLLTSGTVVRFNCVGIPDVLEFESRKTLTEMQIDDLVKLGYLVLSLAARASVGPKNVEQALLLLQQHFSPDLQHVVTTLLGGKSAASQICHMISERVHDEFDSAMAASDALHRYVCAPVGTSHHLSSPHLMPRHCTAPPAATCVTSTRTGACCGC